MRHLRLPSIHLVAATLVITGVLAPVSLLAQGQPPAHPPGQAAPVPPGPYKPVTIKMPAPLNDPSFDAFRKELAQVAEKKDRAGLAKLVAARFFWVPEEKDLADKSKPPIENLAKALSLDGADAFGWEALATYAADGTTMPDPQRRGVICAPAEPEFDEKAADDLANTTHTDAADWAFPIRDGIEVRSEAKQDAPVVDKLGLYLVRVLADESPANAVMAAFLKVVTSSGKVGYVPVEAVLPIGGEQLCYVKEGGAWKIAGFLGGEPSK
jgi:hypothetical protein